MVRPSATGRARATFLKELRETCNVSHSCRVAGMDRRTAYRWREADEAFAADWDEAEQEAIDHLEHVARKRAIDSSDRMLEILLKAHRPEKYTERAKLDVTVIDESEELQRARRDAGIG